MLPKAIISCYYTLHSCQNHNASRTTCNTSTSNSNMCVGLQSTRSWNLSKYRHEFRSKSCIFDFKLLHSISFNCKLLLIKIYRLNVSNPANLSFKLFILVGIFLVINHMLLQLRYKNYILFVAVWCTFDESTLNCWIDYYYILCVFVISILIERSTQKWKHAKRNPWISNSICISFIIQRF